MKESLHNINIKTLPATIGGAVMRAIEFQGSLRVATNPELAHKLFLQGSDMFCADDEPSKS